MPEYTHVYSGDESTYGVTLDTARPAHSVGSVAVIVAEVLSGPGSIPVGVRVQLSRSRVTPRPAAAPVRERIAEALAAFDRANDDRAEARGDDEDDDGRAYEAWEDSMVQLADTLAGLLREVTA